MLKYLISFDESELPEIPDSLDISDRTILQEQINETRRSHIKLIRLYDKLKGDRLAASSKAAEIKREISMEFSGRNDRASEMNANEELQLLLGKIEAFDIAIETIKYQMEFIKNDIRILANSMFNSNK